jgi:Cys-tRNA(Pro)/Cys-tRNA(Cys) deacylase
MKSSRNETFLQFGTLPETMHQKTSNRPGVTPQGSAGGPFRGAIRAALCYNTEESNKKENQTMGKEAKTNAMRILERAKVAYTAHEYPHEEGVAVDGVTVAASIGEDAACVFKTLVTQGASRNYFVFVIPVAAELDLKAAARSVGEKSVAMIHVADINKVTGYVRGGCSPVGMKKQYVTVFDESALRQEKLYVSGGRIGTQICCAPQDLIRAANATTAALTAAL